MDIQEISDALSERFPQWVGRIRRLDFQEASSVRSADNDGRTIYYNERFMRICTPEDRCFYMAQQLLHLQLSHHARRGGREPRVWRRASDAVVNDMLRGEGFALPRGAPLPPEGRACCAEELYELFLRSQEPEDDAAPTPQQQEARPDPNDKRAGKAAAAQTREIDEPGLAAVVAGLAELLEPSMQTDFDWFPGTTIRDGVLRHEFRAYPVACAEILLDTSASVDAELLRAFVRGVKGLLRQDALIRVGCFDTRFYGFQEVRREEDIQRLELRGSGGTDFHAAVAAFTGDAENRIIFTDGFAEMPEQRCDAIWVVYGSAVIHPPGGRVIYSRPPEEKEKNEIDFLIT